MKLYEIPIKNFHLSCVYNDEANSQSIDGIRKDLLYVSNLTSLPELFDAIESRAVACLCVILILPIVFATAAWLFTPLAFITTAIMFAEIIAYISESITQLENKEYQEVSSPLWFESCIDDSLAEHLGSKKVMGTLLSLLSKM